MENSSDHHVRNGMPIFNISKLNGLARIEKTCTYIHTYKYTIDSLLINVVPFFLQVMNDNATKIM